MSTVSGHLAFSYSEEGYLISVYDHTERRVRFEYADGRLTQVEHPKGATFSYTYDESGRLSELTTPLGAIETKSEFDGKNRVTKQYLADGGVMQYIYNDNDKTTTFIQQNGSKMIYKRDKQYRTTEVIYPDGKEKFEFDEKNQKTLTIDKLGYKTHYTYNEIGSITRMVDGMGVKTELNYSPHNQISRVLIDGQEKFQNHYDENGNLTATTDALQHETRFSYLKKGIPQTITQPDGSKIQFTYDARKNITKIIDGSGVVTEYKYNPLNRVVTTVDGNGNETQFQYDSAGNVTEVKNAMGSIRTYAYNEGNKVTHITDFDGGSIQCEYNVINKPSKLVDQLGRETLLGYDEMWNLAHVIEPGGVKTTLIYNRLNHLETIQKPDGSTISYQYDANGNRTGITDEAGNQMKFKYDRRGRLIEVTDQGGATFSYTYNAADQVTSGTDAMGNIVHLTYNAAGQLTEETNALGDSRQYTYTPLGKLATITNEAGQTTRYEYELGGRLSTIHHPDHTKEIYSYDNAGNIKRFTNRRGQAQEYEYDSLNRVIQVRSLPGGSKCYTYDAVNNLTAMTDENGNTTSYAYTATGQLAKVTDALGNETVYIYNLRDQLIEVRQGTVGKLGLDETLQSVMAQNAENRQLRITYYERNVLGQVEAITDVLGQRESYRYDLRGQLIEKLDKDGYLTKYGYTVHGDLNHIQYADGRGVKLSYNPLRQLSEVEDWLGTTKIKVDALGRTTEITNHQDKTIGYTYNATGQKTGIIYPEGKHVSYAYDEWLRLTEVTDGTSKASYHYDAYSRLSEKSFSDGTKTAYQYNDFGQVQALSHLTGDGVLDQYLYSYDSKGNKTEIYKERQGLPEENGRFTYEYDSLNRLQDVLKDGKRIRSYEYDGYGNRTTQTEGDIRTSYTYNKMNQLIFSIDTRGDEQSFAYDKRGNLTEVHRNGVLTNQYQFGALNQLERVTNWEIGLDATYGYNGLGHRVSRSIGGSGVNPTKQIDDVLDLTKQYNNLLERQEDGAITTYMWDGNLLFSTTDTQAQTYLLDDLGSPIRVGQETYAYDEFGNTLYDLSQAEQPFGFTGYQHDSIGGTWFAQGREYDPRNGRFISEDIIKGFVHMPFSMNSYAYCWNRPLDLVDLNGAWPQFVRDAGNWVVDRVVDGANLAVDGLNMVADGLNRVSETIPVVQPIVQPVVDAIEVVSDVRDDLRNLNMLNRCMNTIFATNFISAYRGQLVLKVPFEGRSASLGPVMVLMNDVVNDVEGRELIRHEWGHFVEFQRLGWFRYFVGIGIPSWRGGYASVAQRGPYYAQPWEIFADLFGGVGGEDRTHSLEAMELGLQYMERLKRVNGFGDMACLLSVVFGVERLQSIWPSHWVNFINNITQGLPIYFNEDSHK